MMSTGFVWNAKFYFIFRFLLSSEKSLVQYSIKLFDVKSNKNKVEWSKHWEYNLYQEVLIWILGWREWWGDSHCYSFNVTITSHHYITQHGYPCFVRYITWFDPLCASRVYRALSKRAEVDCNIFMLNSALYNSFQNQGQLII